MLKEIEVLEKGHTPIRVQSDGSLSIKSNDVVNLNRKMGEPDIISILLTETGINKHSDYSSGISVNGASPAQTQYLINGAPVIFPFRFGGLFSTFQPTHFKGAIFSRHNSVKNYPGIGGVIDFNPAIKFTGKTEGNINIGMLASSLSIIIPIAGRFSITTSARASYMDQIYGKLLKMADSNLSYKFEDSNITAAYNMGVSGIFNLSFYNNNDCIKYTDKNFAMQMRLRWSNNLVNLCWKKEGDNEMSSNVFYSKFSNVLSMDIPANHLNAPSSTRIVGGRFNFDSHKSEKSKLAHSTGFNFCFINVVPQWATLSTYMDGIEPNIERHSERKPSSSFNFNLYEMTSIDIYQDILKLEPAVRIGIVKCLEQDYKSLIIDPQLSAIYHTHLGKFTANAIMSSQYYHVVGFSELGLSSDFILLSNNQVPLERCMSFSLGWNRYLERLGITNDITAFYSKVHNQTEYMAQVLEIVDSGYDPLTHITVADGHNYGFSASIHRNFGKIVWKVSYEYIGGRRHERKRTKPSWRSLYDSGSSLKANINWNIKNKWTVSADFVYAAGRVYTPVKSLYLIAGNLAMEYEQINSARLPSYQRLDVGCTYRFKSKGRIALEHIVNFTLINAYGRRNTEMQYFLLDSERGDYRLKRTYSLYRFMPSISYGIQF